MFLTYSYSKAYLVKVNYLKIFLDLICKHLIYDLALIFLSILIFNCIFTYCPYLVLVLAYTNIRFRLGSFGSFSLFSETLRYALLIP